MYFRLSRLRISRSGFSLIEVMVVLVLISLLAGVVGINVKSHIDRGRVKKARADLAVFTAQVKLYYANEGRYPTSSEGLSVLVPEYIDKMSKDPWGSHYQYEFPGRTGAFDIISFGADGREGGEGVARDLVNWEEEGEEGAQ